MIERTKRQPITALCGAGRCDVILAVQAGALLIGGGFGGAGVL